MEMTFENIGEMDCFTLETEVGPVNDFEKADILAVIDDMLDYWDGFVILSAPKAKRKIRYIQCTVVGDSEIVLQIAIEEERTRLLEKICGEEELKRIFLEFYDGNFDPDMNEYTPVQF